MIRGYDRKGIALFLTLGFTALLVMMLTATLTSTHGGNIFSQDYHGKTAALYAAETGLAMVQQELEANPNWTGGFNGADTPFGMGKVWVSFGPSVNNLIPSSPGIHLTGPYGSVAPGTAFIRVEGRAQGQTEVIECVLGRKSEDFLSSAIVATGKIQFDEGIDISGRVSSEDLTPSEADVISNYDRDAPWENGTAPINWDSSATPNDRIAGTVRSASPSANSISPNLVAISSDSLTDQAPVSVENVDIEQAVSQKSGVSSRIDDVPTAPFVGEYYEGGDKVVRGDIILNNASLYVNGDLRVLGSIRGVGAVYVTGDTTFAGDSTVLSNEDGVVLYSQGNVHLRGFNGTEWLDNLAYARGRNSEWTDTKECIRRLTDALTEFSENPQFTAAANPKLAPPPTTPPISDPTADDYYWSSEAGILTSTLGTSFDSSFWPPGISHDNLLHTIANMIAAEPGVGGDYDTQRFMLKKFSVLRTPDNSAVTNDVLLDALGVHDPGGTPDGTPGEVLVHNFEDGVTEGHVRADGLQVELLLAAAIIHGESMGPPRFTSYAGLTEEQLRTALLKHAHWLEMYSFDRMGESYFQGNIYTRGAIYTSNEVTLLGSLAAVADPNADPEPDPWTPTMQHPDDQANGLRPGDVYLGNGTRIVHMGHLKPGLPSATPPVGVVRWLR